MSFSHRDGICTSRISEQNTLKNTKTFGAVTGKKASPSGIVLLFLETFGSFWEKISRTSVVWRWLLFSKGIEKEESKKIDDDWRWRWKDFATQKNKKR
jgi:hypothetical protein